MLQLSVWGVSTTLQTSNSMFGGIYSLVRLIFAAEEQLYTLVFLLCRYVTLSLVQYWTSKGNKFYSIQNRFFRGNWVPGSFLWRLKMSKAWFWILLTSLRVILAPNCPQKIYFRCYKICCLCLSSTVVEV